MERAMMNAMPSAFSVPVAALCALAMGFAIQRGATCTVAAVNQIVDERRCGRLLALGAAATLVLGGLLLAQALDLVPALPPNHAVTRSTVFGGVLLGLGASLNGACALGTIARIGAGQSSTLRRRSAFTPVAAWARTSSQRSRPNPSTHRRCCMRQHPRRRCLRR
jgi:uncharacterized membrane protein YedE/YeeE